MDKNSLESIAKKVFRYESTNSNLTMYPDCYKCCVRMKNRLIKKYDFELEDLSIKNFVLEDYYKHYVLEVDRESYGVFIIDLTFGQFAKERQGDINLGKKSELEDVIVVEKNDYIFSDKLK